jgi:hypothetical protein
MRVMIGYDDREHEAAAVAAKTLREVTHGEIEPEFLKVDKLRAQGLLWRLSDHRGGQDYDLVSNAPKSTRFAISRFLAPLLVQQGWVLFVDCDVVFLRDPREMIFGDKAVYVVKHDYTPTEDWKMVNQRQTAYSRKNWSSVCLWRVDHPANHRLSLRDVNERPGRDLHAFYHLHDDEIGALDPCWNVLVGVQEPPPNAGILHYTLGGAWLPGWKGGPLDDVWLAAANKP